MKRVKIYRHKEWIAAGEFEDPTVWMEEGKAKKWWGDPDLLTFEIEDITYDYELNQILDMRRIEYPSPEEFLNAFFDGNQEEIEKLRQKRIEVKQKYPKPNRSN